MTTRLEYWRQLMKSAHVYAKGDRRNTLPTLVRRVLPEDFVLTPETYPAFERAALTSIERYVGSWLPTYSALVEDVLTNLHSLYIDAHSGELDRRLYGQVQPEQVFDWTLGRFQVLLNQRADILYMLLVELDARLEVLEAHPPRGRQALADALLEFLPSLIEFTSLTTEGKVAQQLVDHLALWLEVGQERVLTEPELEQLRALAHAHFGEQPPAAAQCPAYVDASIELCLSLLFEGAEL